MDVKFPLLVVGCADRHVQLVVILVLRVLCWRKASLQLASDPAEPATLQTGSDCPQDADAGNQSRAGIGLKTAAEVAFQIRLAMPLVP